MTALRHTLFPLTALALAVSLNTQAATVEERLTKLEQQTESKSALPESVEVSGAVEVEGVVGEGYDGRSSSDLVVATVEVGVAAELNDKVSAEVVFLYEQDETPFDVDVATLTIDELVGPVNFTVGKQYVPFGHYETALVNDTLVLELGETNKTAALFGIEQGGVKAGVYAFDGSQDREKHVENYGVTVGFEQELFAVGVDYLSSLTESDGLAGFNEEVAADLGLDPENVWDESAPAYTVFGKLNLGAVSLIAEYLDLVDPLVNEANALEVEPTAAQLELNLTSALAGQDITFAVAYQQTEDAVALELPETRISLGCSTEIYKNVTLSSEIWRDADCSVDDGGSDEESDNLVVQLAASF